MTEYRIQRLEKLLWGLLAVTILMGIYWGVFHTAFFDERLMKEDGIIEYGTVIFLLASGWLVFRRWHNFRSFQSWKFTLVCWLIIAAALFVAGEEISWGQRIFNLETSDYFREFNTQEEINLHNLTVGGVKINKLVFGLLLTISIFLYMLLTPLFYKYWAWAHRLIDRWYIPVPLTRHVVGYVLINIIITLIPASKKWELLEFGSVLIFFLILLYPVNKAVLEPAKIP